MERSQQNPWIQVIGHVAVHLPGRESRELNGATRVLLSILVAAGPDGAPIEEIAGYYWNESRPPSWKVALRVSASHLTAQLPEGWDVLARDGAFRLVPGQGFVDAWRIDQLPRPSDQDMADIDWISDGDLFGGGTGAEIIDAAAQRIGPKLRAIRALVAGISAAGPDSPKIQDGVLVDRIRGSRRSILLAPPEAHAFVARALIADTATDSHIVVGDHRLLLPLGPFAMTFPELRTEIELERGVIETGSASRAFRVVADTLASQAAYRPQHLVLANAPELDTESLQLASLLIDRGRLSDFAMLVCADHDQRDIRWLDFVRRSITAGCDLIEIGPT